MDTTVTNEPGVSQSDGAASSICEKRPLENGENGDLTVRPLKKPRCEEEMKRVAEIVLVLSAMGSMRGGKNPTEAELLLMAEGRRKLAEMCEHFAPKDIVGRDAIGAVIEDLGLNGKLKDQRLGFRAPRLTISEKLSLAKRKMEESKKYPAPSTTATHMSQPGIAAVAERPGVSPLGSASHTVRTLPSDKTNQWPGNEVKATAAAVTSSHYTRDSSGLAQPRVKSDGGSSVLTGAHQGQAISPANHSIVNASTWSVQTQSAFLAKSTAENKVPNQNSIRAGDQSFRPFITQTAQGNFPGMNQPMQGMNFISPSGNNHAEISKTVQKFLQPRVRQNLPWNPPSREYMNKAMTCQICQVTINDVESVLICDACEKGYHLKCLQANNMKGIPKFEWHCTRCVHLCNGKPFPPKYGRVMRSMNTPKVPSNTIGVQLPAEKKVGTMDPKVNQQKTSFNASSGLQGPPGLNTVGSNSSEPTSHTENPNPASDLASDATANAFPNAASSAALNATSNAAPNASSISFPNAMLNAASEVTVHAAVNKTVNAAPCATFNATSDASIGSQDPTAISTGGNRCLEPKSLADAPNVKETFEKNSLSSKTETEQRTSAFSLDNVTKLSETCPAASVALSSENTDQNIITDAKSSVAQEKLVSTADDSASHQSSQIEAECSNQIEKITDNSQNSNDTENALA